MTSRVRLIAAAGPLPIPGPALARRLTAALRVLARRLPPRARWDRARGGTLSGGGRSMRSLPPERRAVAVSVVLVNDRAIRRLNREFLGHDRATDVIAFPLRKISDFRFQIANCSDRPRRKRARRRQSNICNLQSAIPWGEVYVSVATARREAKARGIPIEEELLRYAIHGMLHLFGYTDKTAAGRKRMWARQEKLLCKPRRPTR